MVDGPFPRLWKPPAARRAAIKRAAATAEATIVSLRCQLSRAREELSRMRDATAAFCAPGVGERLLTAAPALASLVEGRSVQPAAQLKRNVALHSAVMPRPSAPLAAWACAQRGPRLGAEVPRPQAAAKELRAEAPVFVPRAAAAVPSAAAAEVQASAPAGLMAPMRLAMDVGMELQVRLAGSALNGKDASVEEMVREGVQIDFAAPMVFDATGDSDRGPGDSVRGPGDSVRGPGNSVGVSDNFSAGFNPSTLHATGDSERGPVDSVRGPGDSVRGSGSIFDYDGDPLGLANLDLGAVRKAGFLGVPELAAPRLRASEMAEVLRYRESSSAPRAY